MDVETPNVSATTNDERTPLIDRAPRGRATKPAAWVWATVLIACFAGVIFLGVSGNVNLPILEHVPGGVEQSASVAVPLRLGDSAL